MLDLVLVASITWGFPEPQQCHTTLLASTLMLPLMSAKQPRHMGYAYHELPYLQNQLKIPCRGSGSNLCLLKTLFSGTRHGRCLRDSSRLSTLGLSLTHVLDGVMHSETFSEISLPTSSSSRPVVDEFDLSISPKDIRYKYHTFPHLDLGINRSIILHNFTFITFQPLSLNKTTLPKNISHLSRCLARRRNQKSRR